MKDWQVEAQLGEFNIGEFSTDLFICSIVNIMTAHSSSPVGWVESHRSLHIQSEDWADYGCADWSSLH